MLNEETLLSAPSTDDWVGDAIIGYLAFFITSLPVLLGVLFGATELGDQAKPRSSVSACFRFDALHQLDIVKNGYRYDPNHRSTVAFFPAYPLISRWLSNVFGLPFDEALLITSNLFLLGTFMLLPRWVRVRWPAATHDQRLFVLLVFGLWPMGLFFRMPYAESLFLFASIALLDGMARGRSPFALAILAGFLTAVRPVGVAATAAFLLWLALRPAVTWRSRLVDFALLTPIAIWGLLAYMAYQYHAFGSPVAFAQTQEHWTLGIRAVGAWHEKALALATLEPIRNVYNSESPRYWEAFQPGSQPVLSVMFWNPIAFAATGIILAIGCWKRWISVVEFTFGLGLLLIPYLTRAYEMSMASHARFAAIVIPFYLLLGRLFAGTPEAARIGFCAILASALTLLSVQFAGGRFIF